MAGARVAMMTSALLTHGIAHLARVRRGLLEWMEAREYASIAEMRGSMSYRSVREPAAFERANYMKVLGSYAIPRRVRARRSVGGLADRALRRARRSAERPPQPPGRSPVVTR